MISSELLVQSIYLPKALSLFSAERNPKILLVKYDWNKQSCWGNLEYLQYSHSFLNEAKKSCWWMLSWKTIPLIPYHCLVLTLCQKNKFSNSDNVIFINYFWRHTVINFVVKCCFRSSSWKTIIHKRVHYLILSLKQTNMFSRFP